MICKDKLEYVKRNSLQRHCVLSGRTQTGCGTTYRGTRARVRLTTRSCHPRTPTPWSTSQRLSTETLFFIFYYMEVSTLLPFPPPVLIYYP